MSVVLIDNAKVLVTMDDERRGIKNGAIVIRDKIIEMLGSSAEVRRELETKGLQPQQHIDASGCILMPVPAWLLVINGRVVLERGKITGLDLQSLVSQHNAKAEQLLRKAGLSR